MQGARREDPWSMREGEEGGRRKTPWDDPSRSEGRTEPEFKPVSLLGRTFLGRFVSVGVESNQVVVGCPLASRPLPSYIPLSAHRLKLDYVKTKTLDQPNCYKHSSELIDVPLVLR